MGLAERRAVKTFADTEYPKIKQGIDAAAGFEVPLEVEWDKLGVDDYAHLYDEAFRKVYFTPLLEAIKDVCIDDMGKDALKDGLKKARVTYSGGSTEISFQNGVLLFDHHPVSNLDYGGERKKELQKVLEKGL